LLLFCFFLAGAVAAYVKHLVRLRFKRLASVTASFFAFSATFSSFSSAFAFLLVRYTLAAAVSLALAVGSSPLAGILFTSMLDVVNGENESVLSCTGIIDRWCC
jgi:hypothetical protein